MAETDNNENMLVRLGHLILDGTPAEDVDPRTVVTAAQVDVSLVGVCRVAVAPVAET